MKSLYLLALGLFCLQLSAQTTFDDLVLEEDSTSKVYKAFSKYHVLLKSKRGSGGMTKTSAGDSIKAMEITDIVLVYTEDSPSDLANRESYNRERWENLIAAYPEYFQFNTNYKNLCQQGANDGFKQSQGFYVYFKGKEEAKAEAVKVEEKKAEPQKAAEKDLADNSKKEKHKDGKSAREESVKEEKAEKPQKKEQKSEVARKEEPKKEKQETKQADVAEDPNDHHESSAASTGNARTPKYTKPKRAKDPKACRLPCYEGGDEGLNEFFKSSISLSKKERRHKGDLVAQVRLQLNFDGTIKKHMVTGVNADLNAKIEAAIKNMNAWNSAVKNGTTVRSDVKFTLKFDKESKGMKPTEFQINPRLDANKCKCASDSELFED